MAVLSSVGCTGTVATTPQLGGGGASAGTAQDDGTLAVSGSAGKGSQGGTANSAGGSAGGGNAFRIIGYEESGTGDDISRIQFGKLTHINYAFAHPNDNGTLQPLENEAKLSALVTRAHAAGITISLSVGGWNNGDDSSFHALVANATSRTTFADEVFAYVQAHGLDGADIDWEYPEADVSAQYTSLMALLSARLRPAGKLLTAAVSANAWGAAGILPDSYQYFDYLMVMAYDSEAETNHSTYAFAESSLTTWLNDLAVPPSKLVLGVPFYSHPSYMSYSAIVAQNAAAAQLDDYDGQHYNGIPTIRAKTQLALQRASGIMIWELSQDTNDSLSLLSTIYSTVHP